MDLTHILIVESDPALADKLRQTLERADDVCVYTAPGLREALKGTSDYIPDLIVIDLNAAVIEGFEVTHVLRSRQSLSAKPVLMLRRSRSTETAGARGPTIDDTAVRQRVNRVLNAPQRRQLGAWTLSRYDDDRLTADFGAGSFSVDGRPVELTAREQELLRIIVEQTPRVVPRGELHDRLWGYDTRSLDVHIRRLRRKLGDAGRQIETALGFGYRFVSRDPHREVLNQECVQSMDRTPLLRKS